MSVRAGAIEDAISFRNLGEIWSGPGFVRFLAKKQLLHSIYLDVEKWCRITSLHGVEAVSIDR